MIPLPFRAVLGLALLSGLSVVIADAAQTHVPLTRAVLYSSGVGYFEHAGQVEGDAVLSLRFRTDEINDVLKSMVLLDLDGGTVRSVDYGSNDPVGRALRSFGIDLSEDPSLPDLLRQLRGARVLVSAPEPVEGAILNVQEKRVLQGDPPVTTEEHLLTLVTGSGIRTLPMDGFESIRLKDPRLNEELAKALELLVESRNKERRSVDIHFAGEGRRRVRVGYLVEVPVWKTSYRLDLTGLADEGDALLQGWAIVENASDSDWSGVELSLVSGRPISFVQDLYTPLYAERPLVEPELAASLRPRAYSEGMPRDEQVTRRLAPARERKKEHHRMLSAEPMALSDDRVKIQIAPASPAEAAPSAGIGVDPSIRAAASGGSVGELFQFTLRTPLELPRRHSAMIPIINRPVDAEKVSIYNERVQARHPLNGLVLRNDTGLKMLAGPVTLFDGGIYAGDARIHHLAPGDKRLLSYAVDLAVAVDPSLKSRSRITSGKIVSGVLHVTRASAWDQTYAIRNKSDEPRTLVLEHPFVSERELVQPLEYDEKTPELYRFRVPLAPGAVQDFTVSEQQVTDQAISIISSNLSNLLRYQRSGEIPEEVRQALAGAIRLRSQVSDLEEQLKETESQLRLLKEGQERLRKNLQAVEASTQLGRRYLRKLNEEEDRIETLDAEIQRLRERLVARRKELADSLGGLEAG